MAEYALAIRQCRYSCEDQRLALSLLALLQLLPPCIIFLVKAIAWWARAQLDSTLLKQQA